MANQSYRRSFTPSGGAEFVYAAPFEWNRDIGEETVDFRIPQGETGGDGEYQADSTQGPRIISIKGRLRADSPSDLQDKLDMLMAAHPSGKDGVLRRQILSSAFGDATIVRDRYIRCRVNSRSPGVQTGLLYADWSISFRAAHPFYLDWNAQPAVALTTPGSTSITAGGTEKCGLILSLNVSGAGLVTVTPSQVAGVDSAFSFAFNAPSSGTYLADMRARTFTKGGVSMIAQITSGSGFFFIPPTAINLVTSGPLASSGSTATPRRAWGIA